MDRQLRQMNARDQRRRQAAMKARAPKPPPRPEFVGLEAFLLGHLLKATEVQAKSIHADLINRCARSGYKRWFSNKLACYQYPLPVLTEWLAVYPGQLASII